ncbi:hypothetical protein KW790_00060 [Candidatus Parcubacteria bacterium]|nr:hypothetical protein [Candidatus Parcubacteria bacterium]
MERYYKRLQYLGMFLIPFWITGGTNLFLPWLIGYVFLTLITLGSLGTATILFFTKIKAPLSLMICLGSAATVILMILEINEILFIPVTWYLIFSGLVYLLLAAFWSFYKFENLWRDEVNEDLA